MTPPPLTSPAARITLVMSCLFVANGVILAFLPRWLEFDRGLAGAEIGAVLSLAQLGRVVVGPAIAVWADAAADRRTPIRALALAAVLAYFAFFSVHGFWLLLAFGFAALSLTMAMTPLVEAATLRATAAGAMPYGVARGIGSLAFIFATTLGGFAVARFGVGAIVVWVLSSIALTAASAWFALAPDPAHVRTGAPRFGAIGALLANRRYLVLITACGLIQSGHAFYYGFSTLVWRGQGIAADVVGLLWGFGVAVEVLFLWNLARVERRIAPEAMILAGGAGGVLRWIAMGFVPAGAVLWPLQALHALSFAATHVGAMRLIYRETPEHSAAMAQTLYSALSAGLLMGGATLLSGVLYDAHGAGGYWAMALISGAGGLLAVTLLGGEKRRPAPV